MTDSAPSDASFGAWLRRLPHYLYVADLVTGRRVLEVGCGSGYGAQYLAHQGAAHVVGVNADRTAIERARALHRLSNLEFRWEEHGALELEDASFDLIFVPQATQLLRRLGFLEEIRRVLARAGTLVLSAGSADRPAAAGGASYYEFIDRLEPLFAPVRMIAQAPFVALSLVEYAGPDGGEPEIELDASLLALAPGFDEPTDYIAVCGGTPRARPRAYTLVQLPPDPGIEAVAGALGGRRGLAALADGAAAGSVAAAEKLAAEALDRVRELEQALGRSETPRRGEPAEGDARRRLARALQERAAAEARVDELRGQVVEAQQELGRMAGEAAIELNESRRELTSMRQRVLALEARQALDEERFGRSAPADRATADLTPAAAQARARVVPPEGRDTADITPAAAQARALVDAPEPAAPEVIEPAGPSPSPSEEPIAGALAAHQTRVGELERELEERTAWADELRDERDRAVAAAADAERRAAAAEAAAAALTPELAAMRSRAAAAEGQLLSAALHRGESGESGESGPAPVPSPDAEGERRIADLEAQLHEAVARAAKAGENWKLAEAKNDEVWRRVGELQTEIGSMRDDSVTNASRQRQAAQASLTRAMEEAGRKLISVQDQLRRTERERDGFESKLAEAKASHGEALATLQAELAQVRGELDHARGELEWVRSERDATARGSSGANGELAPRLDHMAAAVAEQVALLDELDGGLRAVLAAVAGAGESPPLPASAGAAEREMYMAEQLGGREAEVAVLAIGIESLRARVRQLVLAVREARVAMAGSSADEMIEIMDRLAARVASVEAH